MKNKGSRWEGRGRRAGNTAEGFSQPSTDQANFVLAPTRAERAESDTQTVTSRAEPVFKDLEARRFHPFSMATHPGLRKFFITQIITL